MKTTMMRRLTAVALSVALLLTQFGFSTVAYATDTTPKTITAFEPLLEEVQSRTLSTGASEEDVQKALDFPKTVTATLEMTTTEEIPVTWTSDREFSAEEEGDFVYTPEFSADAYIRAEGVALPQIDVKVEAANVAEVANVTDETNVIDETNETNVTDVTNTLALETTIDLTGKTGIEVQGEIETAFKTSDKVIVVGSNTESTEYIYMLIPEGKTVQWKATYYGIKTQNTGQGIVWISGAGTFELAEGGDIEMKAPGSALGGSIGEFKMTGGRLSAPEGDDASRVSSPKITISGGEIYCGNRNAIYNPHKNSYIHITGSAKLEGGTAEPAVIYSNGKLRVDGDAKIIKKGMNAETMHVYPGKTGTYPNEITIPVEITIGGNAEIIAGDENSEDQTAVVCQKTDKSATIVIEDQAKIINRNKKGNGVQTYGKVEVHDNALISASYMGIVINSGGTSDSKVTVTGGTIYCRTPDKWAIYSYNKDTSIECTGGIILGWCSRATTPLPYTPQWTVMGNQTLRMDATIPAGKTLKVLPDSVLNIPDGVILSNFGKITGTVNGKVYRPSTATLSVLDTSGNVLTNNPKYGDTVQLQVTAKEKGATSRAINLEKAKFYLGNDAKGVLLGEASLTYPDGIPTATLSTTISGSDWKVDTLLNLFVEFGGSSTSTLLDSTATGTLQVDKATLTMNDGTLNISKAYDGTATFVKTNISGALGLVGVIGSEDVSVNIDKCGDATNVNVGSKTIALSVSLAGTNKDNYILTSDNYSFTKANITSKVITPTVAISGNCTYTGQQIEPTITVKDGENSLASTDYTITYGTNVNAGTNGGTVIVKAVASGNYSFSGVTTKFDIGQATTSGVDQEYLVVKEYEKEYSYDLSKLLPSLLTDQKFGNMSYIVESVTNTEGVLLEEPTDVDIVNGKLLLKVANVSEAGKTAEVTVTVKSDNFNDFTATITVKTSDRYPVSIEDVKHENRSYTGKAHSYDGTPTFKTTSDGKLVSDITFTKEYEGRDGTRYAKSEIAPTNAGTYNLILAVSGDSAKTYNGSLNVPFVIEKVALTVKAEDKSVVQEEPMPTFTYTVTGLVGTDHFTKEPTLTTTVRDTNTAGKYPITVTGGIIPGADNYAITYVDATLTVKEKLIDQTVTADNTKTPISINGKLTEGANLTATENTNSEGYKTLITTIDTEKNEIIGSFDISITNGSFEGKLTLTFTIGEAYNGKTITIKHLKADGTIETFTEVCKDGKVSITVHELSPFILSVAKDIKTPTEETPKNPETTTPGTTTPEKVSPKTGDGNNWSCWIALMMLAGGVAIASIIGRKKKHE